MGSKQLPGIVISIRQKLAAYPWIIPVLCGLTIAITAILLRVKALLLMQGYPLDGDAIGYIDIAKRCSFYATETREPLFIWMIQLLSLPTGNITDTQLRLFGIIGSLICTGLVFYTAWRWFGLLAGFVSGFAYAISPAMIFIAIRGLREEWVIALFLWLALEYVATWGRPFTWRTALRIGLPLAFGCLIRSGTLTLIPLILVPHIGWSVWKNKTPFKAWSIPALLVSIISIVPSAPYFVYCHNKYDNAFYVNDFLNARFYSNVEFAGRHKDFPTREEFKADGYCGGDMSMYKYLFGYHTIGKVISRHLVGLQRLYIGDLARPHFPLPQRGRLEIAVIWSNASPQYRQKMFTPVYPPPNFFLFTYSSLLSYIVLLFSKQGRLLTFLILVFHLQILFIASLLDFDWRLCTSFYPYISISWGALAACAWLWIKKIGNIEQNKQA